MPEQWQDLATFGVGQLMGSVDANTLINNQKFLRTPANYLYQRDFGDADYTTTSTTFEDIDGTNMNIELETFGNPIRIQLHARLTHSTTGTIHFEIVVDGVAVSNDPSGGVWQGRCDIVRAVDLSRLVPVDPGLHTVILQWRTTAGTATMEVESNIQFEVNEEY